MMPEVMAPLGSDKAAEVLRQPDTLFLDKTEGR
jgi:hypothetical protein